MIKALFFISLLLLYINVMLYCYLSFIRPLIYGLGWSRPRPRYKYQRMSQLINHQPIAQLCKAYSLADTMHSASVAEIFMHDRTDSVL